MDFGKILDQWERLAPAPTMYGKDQEPELESSFERRRRLLRKRPDGTIDLHGLNREEAWEALVHFFEDARERKFEKLLVIHGKGNHTGNCSPAFAANGSSGILKNTVRDFIEHCPFAGESGYSNAALGGAGSTWVLLKENDSTGVFSKPDRF
jgi:DNA-nicking Smr family endonuclease